MSDWPRAFSLRLWLVLTGLIACLFLAFVVVGVAGGVEVTFLDDLYWWGLLCTVLVHVGATGRVVWRSRRSHAEVTGEWVAATILYTSIELVVVAMFLAWLAQPFPV